MSFISIVLAVIYVVVIFKISHQGSQNQIRKIKQKKEMPAEKSVCDVQFSSKPENRLFPSMLISLSCIFFLAMVYTIGKENIDISDTTYILAVVACWIGFIWMGVNSLYYGWVSIATRGEFLIIEDKKVIGKAVSLKGLQIYLIDIEVNISDIKEIIIVKNEKAMGLEITSLNIRTDKSNYEFLMPVDAESVKSIIEKRIPV